jgi:hypothetical protein
MKGSVLVVLVAVVAGYFLYQYSGEIASKAEENGEFMALYDAAVAARQHKDIYAAKAAAEGETAQPAPAEEAAPNAPAALVEPEKAASTDSTVSAAEAPGSAPAAKPARTAFRYPPYVALLLMPLTFAKGVNAAAIAWYWTNVALFIIAMFLSMYALSGSFSTGEKGLYLVPLAAAVPLILFYIPTQAATLLSLVLVIGGLCLFRKGQDVLAGLISSLAIFSPLGVLFALYYVAKRAWVAVGGVLIGAALWLAVAPIIYFGPASALDQSDAYRATVLARLPAQVQSAQMIDAPDNDSLWAVIKRNSAGIDYLGGEVSKYAEEYKVDVAAVKDNWNLIVSIVLGVVFGFATLLGVWRKLRDRNVAIIGLEGALLVAAKLILWPYTSPASLVILVLPLFAVTYVIRMTDVRKFVHHVNYLALVAAAACFYLALREKYLALGVAFAGTFVLWIAVLAAINRFRPHLIRGQRTSTVTASTSILDRPIELVKARADEKQEKPKRKDKGKIGGILPMPSFIRRRKEPEASEEEKPGETPKTIPLEPHEDEPKKKEDKGEIKLE